MGRNRQARKGRFADRMHTFNEDISRPRSNRHDLQRELYELDENDEMADADWLGEANVEVDLAEQSTEIQETPQVRGERE